jgi:uncharacterized protein YjbJ (UPF0337 family)
MEWRRGMEFAIPTSNGDERSSPTPAGPPEEPLMNRDVTKGSLRQLKGKIKEQWVRLTDDEIERVAGHNEQLAGKLQELYGWEKDEAERQISEFFRRHRQLH